MRQMRLFFLTSLLSLTPLINAAVTEAQGTAQVMTPSTMSSAYGQRLKIPGVPNPGKINDNLYRGAQPNEQGLKELKKLGITTIVDLRAEDRGKVEWEKKKAEQL